MLPEDKKQQERAHRMYLAQTGTFYRNTGTNPVNPDLYTKVLNKADHETLSEIAKRNGGADLQSIMPDLMRKSGSTRTVNNLAKLAEEGINVGLTVNQIVSDYSAGTYSATEPRLHQAIESAQKRMKKDYRF